MARDARGTGVGSVLLDAVEVRARSDQGRLDGRFVDVIVMEKLLRPFGIVS